VCSCSYLCGRTNFSPYPPVCVHFHISADGQTFPHIPPLCVFISFSFADGQTDGRTFLPIHFWCVLRRQSLRLRLTRGRCAP
jgi:hypothetical protein